MKRNRKYFIWIGIVIFLFAGYFIADSLLFNGVKPKAINTNGFQANYFVKGNPEKKTALLLIGGGQWGDYWAEQVALKGLVGLSIPYTRREGLPKLPEEINLEYFESAIKWLIDQPEVDENKIIVMGASRNAELALVIASSMPELVNGVVAYAPSSVSWSNTVLPYNSNELKPSWRYRGVDIPYLPMEKLIGNDSKSIETLDYWKSGLSNSDDVSKAIIKVEKINGPVLLISGIDDLVWPSSFMADMLENRLKESNFQHSLQNIKYESAGHLISSHPDINPEIRTGKMYINGKEYEFEYGGTLEGDKKAKQEAKVRLMEFIEKI